MHPKCLPVTPPPRLPTKQEVLGKFTLSQNTDADMRINPGKMVACSMNKIARMSTIRECHATFEC